MSRFKYYHFICAFVVILNIKVSAMPCALKNETVGLLEIHQSTENGQCIILIQQNDPVLLTKNKGTFKTSSDFSKRRYTFTDSGFLELFDADKAQEIQFTKMTQKLNYSVKGGEITVHLPSGQSLVLAESHSGEKGNIKSFQGFSSVKEDLSGISFTPSPGDSLLASSPILGGFPHEKKKSPFSFITSAGKIRTLTSDQIFLKSATTYPLLNEKAIPQPTNQADGNNKTTQLIKEPAKNEIAQPTKPALYANQVKETEPKKSLEDCKNFNQILGELNSHLLKTQGELTLSKLAYFYLKDAGQPTENLKQKITRLLKESSIKDKENLLAGKVAVNSNLLRLKDRLLETQKRWSANESSLLLLTENDFHFLSLIATFEKQTENKDKKSIVNFINLIDSSYRNSDNSIDEKFLALDKNFKVLNEKLNVTLEDINQLRSRCSLEADASCTTCAIESPAQSMDNLKGAIEKAQIKLPDIQWGSFWLHTGRKKH